MKRILIGFLIIGFVSCHTTRYTVGGVEKRTGIITLNEEQISKYLVKNDIGRIKIIQYYPIPCGCGVRMFASNAIGINMNGDTVRILRLCDSTKSMRLELNYAVIRQGVPGTEFSYPDDIIEFPAKYHIYFGKLTLKR